MLSIALIAYRLLVLRFYRKNFSVFLVLSFLVFGIVSPPALFFSENFAKMVFDNGYLTVTIGVIGALYTLWISQNLIRYANHPDHEYLQILPALGKRKFFAIATWLSIGLQAPLMIYFLIISWHGFVLGSPLAFLPLGLCILFILIPSCAFYQLLFTHRSLLGGLTSRNSSGIFKKDRVFLLHLGYLMQSNPLGLFIIKGLSLGILVAFCRNFSSDDPEPVLFGIVLTFVVILHSLLPYWLFRAEDRHLPFLRSLPYNLATRFGQYLLVYIILMIPEFSILMGFAIQTGLTPMLVINFPLMFLGVCLLAQSLLLTTRLSMIEYVKTIFGFFMVQFIALLLGLPPMVLSGLFLAGAILTFWRNYYKWEPYVE